MSRVHEPVHPQFSAGLPRRRLKVVVTAAPEDQTATRLGEEYQATLPALRRRPGAPSAEEARWLGELVMEPHPRDVPAEPLSQLAAMAAASESERWVALCVGWLGDWLAGSSLLRC